METREAQGEEQNTQPSDVSFIDFTFSPIFSSVLLLYFIFLKNLLRLLCFFLDLFFSVCVDDGNRSMGNITYVNSLCLKCCVCGIQR
jgi:hypothetical protein